jgi:hypothetical protein
MAEYHQRKEVNKAIEEAISLGFRIRAAGHSSHAALILLCPEASTEGHKLSVSSTPRDVDDEANKIRRFVKNCNHWQQPPG